MRIFLKGHCSASFWHFEGAMHALWLLMSLRKFWKNMKIFEIYEMWNGVFWFFFQFFFSSDLDQRAWLSLNLASCSTFCVNLVLNIILWLQPITFWSWNFELFILEKYRFWLQFFKNSYTWSYVTVLLQLSLWNIWAVLIK